MNTITSIIVVVVIAALFIAGCVWAAHSRKKLVNRAEEEAKAKADARLQAEREAEQQAKATVKQPPVSESSEQQILSEAVPSEEQLAREREERLEHEPPELAPVEEPLDEPLPETDTIVQDIDIAAEVPVPVEEALEKPAGTKSRLQRLRERLSKSSNPFGKALFSILSKDKLTEADWEDVEDTLLMADVGAEASEQLVESLRTNARITGTDDPGEVHESLREELLALVGTDTDRRLNALKDGANKPSVIIMVGVNGTGKTTTAGKLARLFVSDDKSVMLGAADTFRAAAADQLETWGAKVGVPIVRSDKDGADPASVAFEASAKAKEVNADVLIVDTAGRLQNKANLMDELGKIRRVTEKNLPVDEVLLVLDATTGQNGMTQAKVFAEAIGITGVVLTKLDGSAKGGIVVSVQKELGVPVKLVGVGEGPDDLAPFDPASFVDAILGD